jgi:hypothetical protein
LSEETLARQRRVPEGARPYSWERSHRVFEKERRAREEVRRFAQRAKTNERDRIAYLRSLAVPSEWKGSTQRTIDHLHEAQPVADKVGLPGALWQIRSRIGELHERRGETGQAREAFSRAAQTLRMLAQKFGDEEIREGFLSAPQVRCVLGRY